MTVSLSSSWVDKHSLAMVYYVIQQHRLDVGRAVVVYTVVAEATIIRLTALLAFIGA